MQNNRSYSNVIKIRIFSLTLAVLVTFWSTALWIATPVRSADDAPKASEAQTLLLLRDHLKQISKPVSLKYSFDHIVHQGKSEDSYSDSIVLNIIKVREDGTKDLSFEFFTGKRKRPYQDITRTNSNGLLFSFLQRDIWEMSRELGGLANYFGSKIRKSLGNKAVIEDVTITYGDKELKAQKVVVRPFAEDENKEKLKEYEQKVYVFILSPDIPGEVFEIRTVVPDPKNMADLSKPLFEEVLKFKEQVAMTQ